MMLLASEKELTELPDVIPSWAKLKESQIQVVKDCTGDSCSDFYYKH